ncbi:MAG: chemotaxis protein CheC [Bacillota bacterium]
MEQYVDALQEIGNIGIGNAATALATFLSTKVRITVPKAVLVPVEDIFQVIGGIENAVAAVLQRVDGDLNGTLLFFFPEANALGLVSHLLGQSPGSMDEIDGMGQSVMKEVGNILTGSFLTAISVMTQLTIIPSVPMFTFDMLGSIISSSLLCTGMLEDQVLLIETELSEEDHLASGEFIFFFNVGSLNTLLASLGLLDNKEEG